eukprot:CAMPEP_0119322740 /NCGR_PEP_ID=MMETSP1333-20130426/59041_1 /TAXON_ID=418940 /ORGANISM="Scyphosphaera apsteinii, Strain RCC1455" /LENGTH=65 /DNA_ID=CAMNT_0007330041 /DNA_START=90 /DNA_END=287 /DNA_ORIENTATION=-
MSVCSPIPRSLNQRRAMKHPPAAPTCVRHMPHVQAEQADLATEKEAAFGGNGGGGCNCCHYPSRH